MKQQLDTGEIVFFGQSEQDVEKICSRKAIPENLSISRKGVDTIIQLDRVTLGFDRQRLVRIEFKPGYQYENPLTPFPEQWKNLTPIDGKRICSDIDREEFLNYLARWEERALALGLFKIQRDQLAENEFSVSFEKNEVLDMAYLSMGPTRSASRRGKWCDNWTVFFTQTEAGRTPKLSSISAFRDEFNTAARNITE